MDPCYLQGLEAFEVLSMLIIIIVAVRFWRIIRALELNECDGIVFLI